MPHKNPEEARAWRRKWWKTAHDSREKQNTAARRRHQEINDMLRTHKTETGCVDCGYNSHHAALGVHHEGEKTLNLSFAKSMGQAKREMEKCVVLCSNCHGIRHWDERHPSDTKEEVEG